MNETTIEEFLQANLDEIAETFKDAVPKSYEGLPVIRYQVLDSTPNLEGDDTFYSFSHHVQIDLYSKGKNHTLEKSIEGFIKQKHFKLTVKRPSFEDGVNRTMYQIIIEE